MKTHYLPFILCILLSVVFLSGTASAQIPDPILGMTLETNAITLEIGDTYLFRPAFTTEEISGHTDETLHLFSSDENVIRIAADANTIEAVGGGEAVVHAYTHDYAFSGICTVTVNGAAKSVAAKGGQWENPSANQLAKVSDPGLKAFFELLAQPEMAEAAPVLASGQKFNTLVTVTPGRAESLAGAMEKIGMDPVRAIRSLDMILTTGTAEQYLYLLRSDNILSIDENGAVYAAADSMLEGQADALSMVSTMAGPTSPLNGFGTAIVVIDTGINPSHEQFTGKLNGEIIAPACFNTLIDSDNDAYACQNGSGYQIGSAAIHGAVTAENFWHGTHTAAIAAGKDGVAPHAGIIPINVFHEHNYLENVTWHSVARTTKGDILTGLDYVTGLLAENGDGSIDQGGYHYTVTAVNLSVAEDAGKYTSECKKTAEDKAVESAFKSLLEYNVVPVVAAGDSGYDKAVGWPACAPSAFVVGALWDSADPEVANYSNHAKLVDILAPGTQIYSATGESNNSYAAMNGTSMAAAMASGSMSAAKTIFEYLTAKQMEGFLTESSAKTASRAGIKKPVLDLSGWQQLYTVYNAGTIKEVQLETVKHKAIFGGSKYLQIEFEELPFTTNYTVKVYKGVGMSNLVKTFTGKNLKTAKISKLDNGQVYTVVVDAEATIGGEPYRLHQDGGFGMPMTAPAGLELYYDKTTELATLEWDGMDTDYLNVEFKYQNNSSPSYEAVYGPFGVWSVYDSQPFYATVYRTVRNKNGGDDPANDYLGMPVSLESAFVDIPNDVSVTAGTGKARFNFTRSWYEQYFLTGRQIEIWTAKSGTGEPDKKVKSLTADIKKNPNSIIVTGLKNGTEYIAKIRNVIKLGKKTYTSDWYYEPDKSKPNNTRFTPKPAQAGIEDAYLNMFMGNDIQDLSITVDDKSVHVYVPEQEYFIPDGYRFEVKPVEPNHKLTVIEVPIAKAQNGYTITKLNNGWVYKLRLLSYELNGKKKAYSMAYPNYSMTGEDTSWPGIYFVPLPKPNAQVVEGMSDTISVQAVPNAEADGITVVYMTGFSSGSSSDSTTWDVQSQKWNGLIEGMTASTSPYSGSDIRQVAVMLFKDYTIDGSTTRFYGPAVIFGNPVISDYNVGYGEKSAEATEFGWKDLPEFADAAQVDGQINFASLGLSEKSVESEVEEPEDLEWDENDEDVIVETYEVLSFEETKEDDEEAAETSEPELTEAEESSEETAAGQGSAVFEYDTEEFEQLYAQDEGDPDIYILNEDADSDDDILIFEAEDDEVILPEAQGTESKSAVPANEPGITVWHILNN